MRNSLVHRMPPAIAVCILLVCVVNFIAFRIRGNFEVFKDFVHRDSPHLGIDLKHVSSECAVCKSGVPCEYPKEVDLRVIVLAYNREKSLVKCLEHIENVQLDGASIGVEIWIDVAKDGRFHLPTYLAAASYAKAWTNGVMCVHLQTEHAHVANQWLFSWRPKENSKEIALIVEDDIDVSPHAFRWLRSTSRMFHDDSSVYAYSLQSENVCSVQPDVPCIPIFASVQYTIFKTTIFGTWGFSPKGNFWRKFQDWYIETLAKTPNYKPYVEGTRTTVWYKNAERDGTTQSMAHEMFMLHYVVNHRQKLYCVYNNLLQYSGHAHVQLASHRQENGLHHQNEVKREGESMLLMEWKPDYGNIENKCPAYDAFGSLVQNW